jgi:hypothetical protein
MYKIYVTSPAPWKCMHPQFRIAAMSPGLLRTDYSGSQSIGDRRKMHNEELHNFHPSANTATTVVLKLLI